MIIYKETITRPTITPTTCGNLLRVIRRHVFDDEVYFTDFYYEYSAVRPYMHSLSEVDPVFCIVRNMSQWEAYRKRRHFRDNQPCPYSLIMTGMRYRTSKLMLEYNKQYGGNRVEHLRRMFPLEIRHAMSSNISIHEFDREAHRLDPDTPCAFNSVREIWWPDRERSTPFTIFDDEDHLLGPVLEDSRFEGTHFDIWSLAELWLECEKSGDDSLFDESISDGCCNGHELMLIHQLYSLDFYERLKIDPTTDHKDVRDGLFMDVIEGRYLLIRYVNYYHGVFRHAMVDVVQRFLDFPSGPSYDNLFSALGEYVLGDDMIL